MYRWLLGGLCLAAALPAAAVPTVEARLDTAQVRVGDPLHLELHLHYDQGTRPLLPALPKEFGARAQEAAPPIAAKGGLDEVRRYELRLYQPGSHQIPPLEVAFVQAPGDTQKLRTLPLAVEVMKVRQEGDEELRDIKGPVDLDQGLPPWVWGILAALGVAALAGMGYWWWRRRPRVAAPPPPAPPKDYLAEFSRIAGMGLLERGGYKVYYSLLAETLRRFLEDNLGIEAMEKTTAEIAAVLRDTRCEAGLLAQVEAFLGAADLVKFARLQPGEAEARQMPEAGKAIVRRALAIRAEAEAAERRAREQAATPEG